jgi:hypothetical protein
VVSHHPSDISHLKKIVPKLPMRFCNLALANIVRTVRNGFRKFAYAIGQSEKGRKTEKYTSRAAKVYFPRPAPFFQNDNGFFNF